MESCSSLRSFCVTLDPPLLNTLGVFAGIRSSCRRKRASFQVSAISFEKYIHFAVNETKRQTHLAPSPLQKNFNSMTSIDGKSELRMLSFQAPKIRLLRSLSIENEAMQVLDFAVFPEPEFDMPIFCANFFATTNTNIVVLDLNPLHDVISQRDYREKYYKSLMPLGLKYAEQFHAAFALGRKTYKDYYKVWLKLIKQAEAETDVSQIMSNREAQHRYLTWRAEKDPGHGVLKKLIGETMAKEVLRKFLFDGIDELGSRTFLDYFPEYRSEDGTITEKRSVVGKSFENRPWDTRGEFIAKRS